jgi:hypothetical protein
MSESSKNTNTPPDDIDLLLLIEKVLIFFKKYKWIFITAIALGIVSGISVYRLLPKTYKSRMIVHSFLLTNQEDIQLVDNWNDLLRKKEYAELAHTFNCREEILGKVKQIRADEIQKVFAGVNPHGFFIEVTVTDNVVLDDLQKGIVYAFENSEYVKERLAIKSANLKEMIDKTSSEIQKLDSIKRSIENMIEGKGKISSSLIIDGSGINKQLIEMNEKFLGFKMDLQFNNAVQVLQSFKKFGNPVNPKLVPWLIIGIFIFLSIAFLYSVYHSIKQKLKTRSLQSK